METDPQISPTSAPAWRPRLRSLIAWSYALAIIAACAANSVQQWTEAQTRSVLQWGLVFLAPALTIWLLQMMRRRYAIRDGGNLQSVYPPQRPAQVPPWLVGGLFFVVALLPFMLFLFHDADLLVLVMLACGGVILFSVGWLWFDGVALEVREHGLVVDGVHLIPWRHLEAVELSRRNNVVELLHQQQRTCVYLCPEDRLTFVQQVEERL